METKDNMTLFLEALQKDENLKRELDQTLESADPDNVQPTVLGFAQARGFNVDEQDMRNLEEAVRFLRERASQSDEAEDVRLSEEELQSVAGGVLGPLHYGVSALHAKHNLSEEAYRNFDEKEVISGDGLYTFKMKDLIDPKRQAFWTGGTM